MDKPFVTTESNTDVNAVTNLLSRGHHAVLIVDKGKIVGIITKIDVLSPKKEEERAN